MPGGRGAQIEPCDPAELTPIVTWLARGEPTTDTITFGRGTVIGDRLDLCKQAIGADGARRVLDALGAAAAAGRPAIRAILLGTGAIGDRGAADVAGAITGGVPLDTVYLGCNRIGADGAAALASAIEHRGAGALWLKRNPIGVAGARRLAAMIAGGAALRVLDLYNCELDDAGVAAIAEALGSPRSRIEHVDLGGNAAGPLAAAAIAAMLPRAAVLRSLDLAASRFGDAGAIAIAAGLAANGSLETLDLANAAIGPEGTTAIARAVTGHPRLARLDLGAITPARALGEPANPITDAAAPALAALVATTTRLRALDLRATGITSHGATAIAAALAANASLIALGLRHGIAKTILRRVRARLAHNATLAPPLAVPPHVAAIQSVYRARR